MLFLASVQTCTLCQIVCLFTALRLGRKKTVSGQVLPAGLYGDPMIESAYSTF